MVSKNKRKKLDLYWPTVFILSMGVLLGAVFLGKYIGESFISGNSFKTSQGDSNSVNSPEIKTLSKPTIVPQSNNLSSDDKNNSTIILPPSFKSDSKYKHSTSEYAKETPTPAKKQQANSSNTTGIVPTSTPLAVSGNNKTSTVGDDTNSGKTKSEIDKMIGVSKPEKTKQEEQFDRVELNEDQSSKVNNNSYKVQAGYYGNKDNASKQAKDLTSNGYDATVVQVTDDTGKTYYSVQAGSFNNKENAKKLEKDLEKQNYHTTIVTSDKH